MSRLWLLVVALVLAVVAACSGGDPSKLSGPDPGGTTPPGPSGSPTNTSDASPSTSELLCGVQAVLQAKCVSCHASTSPSLATYADLTAKSTNDPTKTVAERSVIRMQASKSPMPPSGNATSADIQTIQGWIAAGYPNASCGDAGATDASGATSTTNYNTPVVCTSGVTNSSEGLGSRMHPGGACNACHAKQGATIFTIAGTVYPTAHEPDDCYGVVSNAAQVVVLDSANKTQLTLYTNESGNFSTTTAITTPYKIKVLANGKERDMIAAETNGDCNACHTESGASGAPGRIMSP